MRCMVNMVIVNTLSSDSLYLSIWRKRNQCANISIQHVML